MFKKICVVVVAFALGFVSGRVEFCDKCDECDECDCENCAEEE